MSATTMVEAAEMTETMKGWGAEGKGSAEVLRFRDVAKPEVTDGRVLVKVRASSVNAADYHGLHGGWIVNVIGKLMRMGPPPAVLGGDVAGIVEAVGKDITAFRVGDEVCGSGRGSWAEYTTGTERSLVKKPKNVPFEEAGAIGVASMTALQGLRDKGELKAGQRVLIFGAGGGVGTFAVQIAKALGAHVTAVTGPRTIDLVRPLGADVLIDYSTEDVKRRGERYDVIFDVAATRSIGYLRSMLVPDGILVLAGAPKSGGFAMIFAHLIASMFRARVLKQRVRFYIASINAKDLAFITDLMAAGKVRTVIDRTFPFSETREAVRYAEKGMGRAKVVITVD